jgi:hypothetical protein
MSDLITLRTLFNLQNTGFKLNQNQLNQLKSTIYNSDFRIRKLGLELIDFNVNELMYLIKDSNVEIRINCIRKLLKCKIDHISLFKLLNSLQDPNPRVRCEICKTVSILEIPFKLLKQTLSKNNVNISLNTTTKQLNKETINTTRQLNKDTINTTRQLNKDTINTNIQLNKDTINTNIQLNKDIFKDTGNIPSGEDFNLNNNNNFSIESGLFIYASEDEYKIVRNAAINSMFILGMKSFEFAKSSLGFLIDLFNDEDETTRQKAVENVYKLNGKWNLIISDSLVSSIILILLDTNEKVKRISYKLSAVIKLNSFGGFESIVKVLIKIIQNDKETILFRALSGLARNHPRYTGICINNQEEYLHFLFTDSPYLSKKVNIFDTTCKFNLTKILAIWFSCSVHAQIQTKFQLI